MYFLAPLFLFLLVFSPKSEATETLTPLQNTSVIPSSCSVSITKNIVLKVDFLNIRGVSAFNNVIWSDTDYGTIVLSCTKGTYTLTTNYGQTPYQGSVCYPNTKTASTQSSYDLISYQLYRDSQKTSRITTSSCASNPVIQSVVFTQNQSQQINIYAEAVGVPELYTIANYPKNIAVPKGNYTDTLTIQVIF